MTMIMKKMMMMVMMSLFVKYHMIEIGHYNFTDIKTTVNTLNFLKIISLILFIFRCNDYPHFL